MGALSEIFYVSVRGRPVGEAYAAAGSTAGSVTAYDALRAAFGAVVGVEIPDARRTAPKPYRLFRIYAVLAAEKEANSDNKKLRMKTRREIERPEFGLLEKRLVGSYVMACPAKSLSEREEFVMMADTSELEMRGQLVIDENVYDLLKVDALRGTGRKKRSDNAYNEPASPISGKNEKVRNGRGIP